MRRTDERHWHREYQLSRRSVLGGLFSSGAALTLGGCSKSVSYRYKLSLSLDTPDGSKTGFNVVQIDYQSVPGPSGGTADRAIGQGIFIDLGSGRRPLIALLTHNRRADETGAEVTWHGDDPAEDISAKLLNITSTTDWYEVAARFGTKSAPISLSPLQLPDLVTFSDINDPKTLMLVDPDNLTATLGPGVSWQFITIQIVDEPLTKGIDERLPWIRNYDKEWVLDERMFFRLDNRISRYSFVAGE